MTDLEKLSKFFDEGKITENDLRFGRQMPFGKYKGKYICHLLVKHWRYMDWVAKNTRFDLNDIEVWWKNKIDLFIEMQKADNLIRCLCGQLNVGGIDNIENPHFIIE